MCSTGMILERTPKLTPKETRFNGSPLLSGCFLDFSEAVSDLVSAFLMCNASGSECDSDACWDPGALQAPWIRLSCDCLPSHSAQAVPNTACNCWDASSRRLEQGVVLFLLSSPLGPLSFPAAWQNMGPSNKAGRKEGAQSSLGSMQSLPACRLCTAALPCA